MLLCASLKLYFSFSVGNHEKSKKETEMFSVKNSAVCKMVANQAGADHHSNNDALIIEMPNMTYG